MTHSAIRDKQEVIALFAYDFPHRKTSCFLRELKFLGFEKIVVIAAPKILISSDSEKYFEEFVLETDFVEDTELICKRLNYPYYKVRHDDVDKIETIVRQFDIKLAIISGARIIKKNVILLFDEGIINFHPGKIPETSGLDSFFYTIQKNIPAGVTVHCIDERVDAGRQWIFEPVNLSLQDVPATIIEKLFWLQISLLRKFLLQRNNGNVDYVIVDRPEKNSPMDKLDKYRFLQKFPQWLLNQVYVQRNSNW